MRGLCTSEGEKFKNFFALVQEEAKKKDAIFFLESGDGRDFELFAPHGIQTNSAPCGGR